jgi:hypothetical protein
MYIQNGLFYLDDVIDPSQPHSMADYQHAPFDSPHHYIKAIHVSIWHILFQGNIGGVDWISASRFVQS